MHQGIQHGVKPHNLLNFAMFQKMDDTDLLRIAEHASIHRTPNDKCLIRAGNKGKYQFFLLKGTVQLESGDGDIQVIKGEMPTAKFPLAYIRPSFYTVKTLTPVILILIEDRILSTIRSKSKPAEFHVDTKFRGGDADLHEMVVEIYHDLNNGCFELPSIPVLAAKIKRVMQSEYASFDMMSKVISADPAISAKLLKASNGATYHGVDKCATCSQALFRLGLETGKKLIMSFAMSGLFRVKVRGLQRNIKKLWSHSLDVAAISSVLARLKGKCDPEQAMLAGLLHDIGALPIVSYAKKYPDLIEAPDKLEELIDNLKGRTGEMILQNWSFDADLIQVAVDAENWQRYTSPEIDLCDIVQVAQIHHFAGTPKFKELPPLQDIPAFVKISGGSLSAQKSIEVLESAHEQIKEIKNLLLG